MAAERHRGTVVIEAFVEERRCQTSHSGSRTGGMVGGSRRPVTASGPFLSFETPTHRSQRLRTTDDDRDQERRPASRSEMHPGMRRGNGAHEASFWDVLEGKSVARERPQTGGPARSSSHTQLEAPSSATGWRLDAPSLAESTWVISAAPSHRPVTAVHLFDDASRPGTAGGAPRCASRVRPRRKHPSLFALASAPETALQSTALLKSSTDQAPTRRFASAELAVYESQRKREVDRRFKEALSSRFVNIASLIDCLPHGDLAHITAINLPDGRKRRGRRKAQSRLPTQSAGRRVEATQLFPDTVEAHVNSRFGSLASPLAPRPPSSRRLNLLAKESRASPSRDPRQRASQCFY